MIMTMIESWEEIDTSHAAVGIPETIIDTKEIRDMHMSCEEIDTSHVVVTIGRTEEVLTEAKEIKDMHFETVGAGIGIQSWEERVVIDHDHGRGYVPCLSRNTSHVAVGGSEIVVIETKERTDMTMDAIGIDKREEGRSESVIERIHTVQELLMLVGVIVIEKKLQRVHQIIRM